MRTYFYFDHNPKRVTKRTQLAAIVAEDLLTADKLFAESLGLRPDKESLITCHSCDWGSCTCPTEPWDDYGGSPGNLNSETGT